MRRVAPQPSENCSQPPDGCAVLPPASVIIGNPLKLHSLPLSLSTTQQRQTGTKIYLISGGVVMDIDVGRSSCNPLKVRQCQRGGADICPQVPSSLSLLSWWNYESGVQEKHAEPQIRSRLLIRWSSAFKISV
ncbi:hypothetical protein PROFUN_09577 [Planoprotostelium fungivorum]|uniref:Uncharacterized protein n=1 Tax=Planoprotostelium fungivorum TaxID=1890364 RepID=A0A2P6NGT7_9EUKA|nr:hypothetical protein PROFUN_09577 [Planoprotostelium fungivorum]